jgi:hypothetical protein
VRQVFYRLVGAYGFEKTEAAYGRLCDYLVRARRARMIEFGALRDDGVSLLQATAYNGVWDFHDETAERARAYRRDRQASQPVRLELWCEASGMIPQLGRVAGAYSVPVFSSGSGFASVPAVRSIVDRAIRRDGETVILHVGDFDPSGVSIFDHLAEDAAAFVREDRTIHTQAVRAVRVALTPEQVDDYDLPTVPPKRTDSRSARWQGGTCQLEALPPDTLAALVREAILAELDEGILETVLELERLDRATLLGLASGGSS